MATLALTCSLAWALGGLMHWWPRLRPRHRRSVSIATGAAGLAFLVAGTSAEGLREAATTSVVVVGPAYLTATTAASASLYYYVLTAVCLLLGFAGLALGEPLGRGLRRHWVLSAAAVAWLVTALRILLEKSAAPALLTQALGVTWLPPIAGAFFAVSLREAGSGPPALRRPLLAYAYLVRGLVALVAIVATRFHLGTHYDVSPLVRVPVSLTGTTHLFESGSWTQILWLVLVPQLVIWPVFTVAAGFLGGAIAFRWLPKTRPRVAAAAQPEVVSSPGRD